MTPGALHRALKLGYLGRLDPREHPSIWEAMPPEITEMMTRRAELYEQVGKLEQQILEKTKEGS